MKKRVWAKAANKIYAEGSCRACDAGGVLDPAHIIPRSQGGDENPLNIVPLCRACHTKQHDGTGLELLPALSLEEQAYAVSLVGIERARRYTTTIRRAA